MLDLEDEAAPGRFRQAVRAGLVQEGFVAPRYAFTQLVPKQITNLKLGKFACGAYKRVRIRALAGLRLPFAGDNLAIGALMDTRKVTCVSARAIRGLRMHRITY